MDCSPSDDPEEKAKSDAYRDVLIGRIVIAVGIVVAILVYFNLPTHKKESQVRTQLLQIANVLSVSSKTGDRETALSMIDPTTKIINDYNDLAADKKAEINSGPTHYCVVAARGLAEGIAEISATGTWLSEQKFRAAMEICE